MTYILFDFFENLIIFSFLAIAIDFSLITNITKLKTFKLLIAFVLLSIFSYTFQIYISNKALVALLFTFATALTWNALFLKISLINIAKVSGAIIFLFIVMLIAEFYFPAYFILTDSQMTIENSTFIMFFLSIPSRIIEILFIVLIYLKQKTSFGLNVKLATLNGISTMVSYTAAKTTSIASFWWFYQPKIPKGLKENNKKE